MGSSVDVHREGKRNDDTPAPDEAGNRRRRRPRMREFQTRSFETSDDRAVLKALVNILQDDGYVIKEANTELGLLSATKELDIENTGEVFVAALFGGAGGRRTASLRRLRMLRVVGRSVASGSLSR